MVVTPTKVISFYTFLVDHDVEQLHSHLTDDVVLYWYGRTVKGKDSVVSFLSEQIANPEHNVTSVQPLQEIQHRGTVYASCAYPPEHKHRGCAPVTSWADDEDLLKSACESSSRGEDFPGRTQNKSALPELDISPPEMESTPQSKIRSSHRNSLLREPRKRKPVCKLRYPIAVSDGTVNCVEARGTVSYYRVGWYGCEREFNQELNLQLAYRSYLNIASSYEISLIIYSGGVQCRRNLFKEFEKMAVDRESS